MMAHRGRLAVTALALTVAGCGHVLPLGRFQIITQSKNQALQLQRTLVPSD